MRSPDGQETGRPAAILIAGPTASGKSALGLRIARAFGGTVINTDSMQVYADLRVLSARPTAEEEELAPHRLYGSIDGAVNFSVGHFQRQAAALLSEMDAGTPPVFVGGTGLYFRSLDEGISDLPEVPDAIRQQIRAEADGQQTETLHAAMRALQIHAATGRSIGSFHEARVPGPLAGKPLLKLFLATEREALRQRIDARFVTMMEQGALDEVAALRERRLDPLLPVMRAHGVPGLIAYLDGTISREEAIQRGQGDTRWARIGTGPRRKQRGPWSRPRRYAKRQFTWFRHRLSAPAGR
uniref:tRNA dimethylallyltransferase n=1 Tax=Methylorubrum extorquens TaxID=408 RepID=Q8VQS5_METEX|nr:isopentenyl tRNA transferase [Methylorubrum extorquens]